MSDAVENEKLREQILDVIVELAADVVDAYEESGLFSPYMTTEASYKLVNIVTSSNKQLLEELEAQAEILNRQTMGETYPTSTSGICNIYYEEVKAVPLSIIQDELKALETR